jgi:hypothetical protein
MPLCSYEGRPGWGILLAFLCFLLTHVHGTHADESPEEVDYYDYDQGLPPGCVETSPGAPSPGPALAPAGAPLPDGKSPVSGVHRSIVYRIGSAVSFATCYSECPRG